MCVCVWWGYNRLMKVVLVVGKSGTGKVKSKTMFCNILYYTFCLNEAWCLPGCLPAW